MGTPCDPFSEQRNKRYVNGSVKEHPLFAVTFRDAIGLLRKECAPKAAILEQVMGFDKPETREGDSSDTFMQRQVGCCETREPLAL